jgi:hypothetical protein
VPDEPVYNQDFWAELGITFEPDNPIEETIDKGITAIEKTIDTVNKSDPDKLAKLPDDIRSLKIVGIVIAVLLVYIILE